MAYKENWEIDFDISSGKYVTMSHLLEGTNLTNFIILITMAEEVLPTTLHKLLEGIQCLISKQNADDVSPPMLAEI